MCIFLFVLALMVILPSALAQADLTGTRWQLDSNPAITLEFSEDGRAGGSGGCNTYGSGYTVDGTSITFSMIVSTLIACAEDVMTAESDYFAALETATGYELSYTQLIITLSDGEALVYSPLATLAGSAWQLVSFGGTDVIEGSTVTLAFDDTGEFAGSGGCNNYRGSYTLDGDTITLGEILSTRRACTDEATNTQEQAYFDALQAATRYLLDGDQLTIVYGDEEMIFMRATTLANTTWQLESLGEAPVVEGSTITLEFDADNRAAGSGGCNRYSGTYTADGESLRFSPLAATKRACLDDGIGAQEQAYFNALAAATSYTLADDRLTITYGDGQALVFVATGG
jgi:heat shock protein HslJ